MTDSGTPNHAEEPESEKTEGELDEEALERFEDESLAPEPHFTPHPLDPDDSPEQPNDEA
jgi:hypothetical protein